MSMNPMMEEETPRRTGSPDLQALRERLREAEETLRAIRTGEADAVVVDGPDGPRVYTLVTADQSYRTLVEQMREAALILSGDGIILYCNNRLRELLGDTRPSLAGRRLADLVVEADRPLLADVTRAGAAEPAEAEVRFEAGIGDDPFPMRLSVSALTTGGFSGIAVIATDLREKQRREAAAERQRVTDAVLQFAGTGILVCDAAGRILRANQLATDLLGETLGHRHIEEVLPLTGPLQTLAERGDASECELRRADGERVSLLVRLRSLAGALPSEDTTWVLTLTDITARKRAEESLREGEQRLRIALGTSPVIVGACDLDLRYTWLHNTHPSFAAADCIGKRDDEIAPAEDMKELVAVKEEVLRTGAGVRREIGLRLGQEIRYYDTTAEPLLGEAGEMIGVITAASDVTDLRRAEQAAERANRAKGEFLAVMSHELRTPLNSVIGYSDLLLLDASNPLTPRQVSHTERIQASARHQLALIEEILAYTRIDAGHEHLQIMSTDAARILRDAVEFVRPLAEGKKLDLQMTVDADRLEIATDPGKLRQIVLNLLSNAVKFTRTGGVHADARFEEDELVVRVQDTGLGIPESMRETIFEPFAQVAQPTTREAGGTGLGLAIVRRMAELLGGYIQLDSSSSEGSIFSVHVPRGGPAGHSAGPDQAPA